MKNKSTFIGFALFWIFVCIWCYVLYTQSNTIKTAGIADSRESLVVVIDAGHGGLDGGAVAQDGTQEKGINLAIAQKLRAMLQAAGIETVMTRNEDISIHNESAKTVKEKKTSDIKNRLKIVQNTENSILVSIHQNHFSQEKYNGMQVFYSPNDQDSPTLADCIQKSTVALIQPENQRAIKKADSSLYLLYRAASPSVLVECGFMSNATENNKLKSDAYQNQIAFCIFKGILDYRNTPAE